MINENNKTSINILVVDDHPEDAEGMILTAIRDNKFEEMSFNFIYCKNSSEAIETAINNKIDLALVDYKIDTCTGVDIIKALNQTHNFPSIVFSSTQDIEDVIKVSQAHAVFISKNDLREQLYPLLTDVLSHYFEKTKRKELELNKSKKFSEIALEFNNASCIDEILKIISKSITNVGFDYSVIYKNTGNQFQITKHITGIPAAVVGNFPKLFGKSLDDNIISIDSENIVSRCSREHKQFETSYFSDFVFDSGFYSVAKIADEIIKPFLPSKHYLLPIGKYGVVSVSSKTHKNVDDKLNWLKSILSQAEITIKRELLKESIIEKEKMAAVGLASSKIVHDINNILGGLYGYVDMALESLKDSRESINNRVDVDKIESYLRKSMFASDRIRCYVKEILEFSKIGKTKYKFDVLDVCEGIKSAHELLDKEFKTKGIDLIDNLENGFLANIDILHMSRVYSNLAKNVIDIARPDTYYKVSNKIRNKTGIFMFEDNLGGIPEAIMSKLFTPFTTYGKTQGTGLGLASSKEIVEKHKGKLYVENTKYGAKFIIELPLAE